MRKRSVFAVVAIFALLIAAIVPASVSAGQTVTHVYEGDSIQIAVDVAEDGDKIIVHPGTYYENIIIDKSVSLKAVEGAVVDSGMGNGFTIVESDVSIQGFIVTGVPGRRTMGIYIASYVTGCTIKNNVIENKIFGIRVYGYGNTITGNECSGSVSAGIGLVGNQNTVSHNICYDNSYGIAMRGDQNAVSHNKCYDNLTAGILTQINVAEGNTLTHNLSYDNGGAGMAIGGSEDTVAHNLCYGNTNGIRASGTNNTFESNICRENIQYGFWVDGSDHYFEHNVAVNNLVWDLYDEGLNNTYAKNVFGTEGP
jgi:parallel beta-helix repeat protein